MRQALGRQDGPLTQVELSSLTQLSVQGMQIRRLDGVEQLSGLTAAELASNQIADLKPLSGLTSLEFLDLEDNQVEDISPLASLAALRFLVLNFNRIADVAVLAGLPALVSVELKGNPLNPLVYAEHIPALQERGVTVYFDPPEASEEPASPASGWEHLGPEEEPVRNLGVLELWVCPAHPEFLYAFTENSIWRSSDGGEHWSPTTPPGVGYVYDRMFVDPVDPLTIYTRLDRSRDGGQSWEKLGPGVLLRHVDPVRPGCLYAVSATADTALLISRDDGASWEELAGLDDGRGYTFVRAHPADPRIRYVSIIGRGGQGSFLQALLRSDDNAQTWSQVQLGRSMVWVAPDPRGAEFLYGLDQSGIWHSEDSGATWTIRSAAPVAGLDRLEVHPASPDWMWWWSTGGGVLFESRDAGTTWKRTIFRGAVVIPHPQDNNQAYVLAGVASGSYGTLLRTRDGGNTYQPVALQSLWRPVQELAFDLTGTLYGVTWRQLGTDLWPVLLISIDGGSQWFVRDEQFRAAFRGWVDCLHANPHHPGLLIAHGAGRGFLRSEDEGNTWQPLTLNQTGWLSRGDPEVAAGGLSGEIYYALDPADAGLYRSEDLGRTWARVRPDVGRIALHPDAPEVIYASALAGDRVWRSQDGGQSWEDRGAAAPGEEVLELACDPRHADHLIAATRGGLYESQDGGQTWGFLASVPITSGRVQVCFHPEDPAVLYLLTAHQLLGSADAGRTWASLSEVSASMPPIEDVALDPAHPGTVYAATALGIFRMRWPAGITAVLGTPETPTAFALEQNYPNPFNAATLIRYRLERAGPVRLTLYDVAGQQVKRLVDQEQPAGPHQVRWEEEGQASGVYFYRLEAGPFTESRRMLLVK